MSDWGERLEKNKVCMIGIGAALVIVSLILFFSIKGKEQEMEAQETVLSQIDSYRGFVRVISEEELEFYKYFVERELPQPVEEETLLALTKEYANKVNAAFYLGNKWGLCEPYSFENLKLRMEQENLERKVKLEEGEVIYGLEEFSLEIYFEYVMDNLELSLKTELEAKADAEIMNLAKTYYEKNAREGYEDNVQMALHHLIEEELYDSVIDTVAKNNPAEFETN